MSKTETIIIKKYPNRRLYNTQTSIYIKIEDLIDMVRKNEEFVVMEVKSNKDITRITLAQILLELEIQGIALLPDTLIKTAIKIHDNPMHKLMHDYILQILENMESLGSNPFLNSAVQMSNSFEDMHKKNMEYFTGLWHNFRRHSDADRGD